MDNFLYFAVASEKFFYIMVSFAFFIGLVLMVSPEGFEFLNRAMLKEYGLKKKLLPKLEDSSIDTIDKFAIRNRTVVGMLICLIAFILIMAFK